MKAIKYILFFYLVVFFSVTAQAKKDKLRIGAIYAIILEAFKLGS